MKLLRFLFVFSLLVLLAQNADAQCAMCKAVAQSSQEGGSGIADGLNGGIIYLMFFPYLLMAAVGIALYRHKKTRKA